MFDLNTLEERLLKSGVDVGTLTFIGDVHLLNLVMQKAKSDNKYYAAMRDKEAIESERKNLARTLEKQGKVVDRLVDVEKHLKSQLVSLQSHNLNPINMMSRISLKRRIWLSKGILKASRIRLFGRKRKYLT